MARKKTTLYINKDLKQLAKAKAAIQDKTLGNYLNELIADDTRELLSGTTLSLLKKKNKSKGKEK